MPLCACAKVCLRRQWRIPACALARAVKGCARACASMSPRYGLLGTQVPLASVNENALPAVVSLRSRPLRTSGLGAGAIGQVSALARAKPYLCEALRRREEVAYGREDGGRTGADDSGRPKRLVAEVQHPPNARLRIYDSYIALFLSSGGCAAAQRPGGGPFVLFVVALPGGLDLPLLATLPAGLGRLLVTGLGGLGGLRLVTGLGGLGLRYVKGVRGGLGLR